MKKAILKNTGKEREELVGIMMSISKDEGVPFEVVERLVLALGLAVIQKLRMKGVMLCSI